MAYRPVGYGATGSDDWPRSTPARDLEVLSEYRFNQETRMKVTGGCQTGRRMMDCLSRVLTNA
jgi:hypothetical protein